MFYELKRTLDFFIIKIVVYTLLQDTRTGAVVMAEVKVVMGCKSVIGSKRG